VPPISPLSGNELASVACSPENKVSLCGVGGLRVATPLQRRRTSPQKEGTTGIHPCVSGLRFTVTSYPYLYLACVLLTCFLLACHLGNSPSCTSSEFISCQALKFEKGKIWCSAYSPPPSSRPLDPFNWYQSKGSLIGLNHLRDNGRRGARH
jgi:hypothetical protein